MCKSMTNISVIAHAIPGKALKKVLFWNKS